MTPLGLDCRKYNQNKITPRDKMFQLSNKTVNGESDQTGKGWIMYNRKRETTTKFRCNDSAHVGGLTPHKMHLSCRDDACNNGEIGRGANVIYLL